jgi:hypothetical protein
MPRDRKRDYTKTAYEQLRLKQRDFVDHVVARKTYTEAAALAYGTKRPGALGNLLMKSPRIWEAVQEREMEHMREVGIRTEQILLEMARIAFMPLTPSTANAKVKALQCLGLFKGIWGNTTAARLINTEEASVSDGTTLPNDSRVVVNIRKFSEGPEPVEAQPEDRHLRLIHSED